MYFHDKYTKKNQKGKNVDAGQRIRTAPNNAYFFLRFLRVLSAGTHANNATYVLLLRLM